MFCEAGDVMKMIGMGQNGMRMKTKGNELRIGEERRRGEARLENVGCGM